MNRIAERAPIFFPPNPPPLGRPVGRLPTPPSRLVAPSELAEYVDELFYAPLSTRLATSTLTEKLRHQLDDYHTRKLALAKELRTELERVRDLDPSARQQALEALSRRQAPSLADLEKASEQLRHDLIAPEAGWSDQREWHLSDRSDRGFSPFEISQVMRAAAYYQNGLLPAQRRLLREISIELAMAANNTATATAAQPFVFFPPEPARVLIPEDLPAEVAAKVSSFQTKKSVLKKELYDAVYAQDGATLGFLRGNTLKSMAEKQSERLAALDTLAEEIRRGLALLPQPAEVGVERSPLPPSLSARVAALVSNLAVLQKDAAAKVESVIARNKNLPIRVSYNFEADGLNFFVVPGRGFRLGTIDLGPKMDAVRNEITPIAEDYGRHLAEAINERDQIRREVAQAIGSEKPAAIEAALSGAARATVQKENTEAYRTYRTAVFEPGLSAAQRRVLFDSAVEQLELPLPRGELQPTRRAASW